MFGDAAVDQRRIDEDPAAGLPQLSMERNVLAYDAATTAPMTVAVAGRSDSSRDSSSPSDRRLSSGLMLGGDDETASQPDSASFVPVRKR